MGPSDRTARRGAVSPGFEALESRRVPTGGAGAIFAVVPSNIAKAGGTADVAFTISPASFVRPHGDMLIGIDVSGQGSPAASPTVVSVTDSRGHALALTRGTYDPSVRAQLNGKVDTSAVLVHLPRPSSLRQPATYTVHVGATGGSSGDLRVGFYLPGDASGGGVVDRSALDVIRSKSGTRVGDPKYSLDADVNRDGRIDQADLNAARRNLGVKTTINPSLTAAVSPAAAIEPKTHTTSLRDLSLTGTASPGASVVVDELKARSPEVKATADAAGKYSLVLHLADGPNSFSVTSTDSFGQSKAGVIPMIQYVSKPKT